MDSSVPRSGRTGWIHKLGAIGAIALPLALLFSFFTSSDSGDTASELIAYAKENESEAWVLQIIALGAPLLLGPFVAALWDRLRGADDLYRALAAIGGTLFVAFLGVGLTLWAAPLLSADELTDAGADAYLAFDDVGWVLLALGGISIGTMIVAASLGALQLGLLPKWAGWVSIALGVLSLATMAAIGLFAWALWLLAAGVFLLLGRDRLPGRTETAPAVP